jgi:DUF4097 and DUF4098 domain-containing protein YvlB
MKHLKYLLTLFLITSALLAQSKDLVKTFDVEKGITLHARINPGDIVIRTWEKSQVLIKVKGMDQEDYEDVEMFEKSNILYLKFNSSYGWSDDYTFDFTVPENCHLEISTTGGDISIKNNLTGRVSLNTSGGDIDLMDVSGKLQANTSGGDIEVGNVNGPAEIATSGGDINVKVISGESAQIKTMGGDIEIEEVNSDVNAKTYGGDIKIGDVGGKAEATTFGGDVRLGHVAGSAKMETYGGNLELKSATGKVDADTKGGDIRLMNVKGSLKARTAGGEVYAELDPSGNGESQLRSSGGKITLILPSDAKTNIEAEIKIRGRWDSKKHDYTITSDFMTGKPLVDDDEKEISAQFNTNGGGEKIKIRTVNSNIVIKKK